MVEEIKLNETTLSTIADTLKVNADDLKSALVSETETSIIPEGTFFTPDELSTREANLGDVKYKEGKTAGAEMTVKDVKNFNGLDFEGKDISVLNEKLADKIKSAGSQEPSEKITELNKTIDGLRFSVTDQEGTISNLQNKITKQGKTTSIMNAMPDNLTMDKTDAATLFELMHDIVDDEGKEVVKRNGSILKDDKLQEPLSLKQSILNFSTEKGWLNGNGNSNGRSGRGNGSNGAPPQTSVHGIIDAETFNAYCTEKGIKPHSKEQTAILAEVMKANADFKLE